MSECTHNCADCGQSCNERTEPQSMILPANSNSNVKKIIGVVSGKGGVGKSMVTAMLAVIMARRGFKTAILDADITGPSIPKMFSIKGRALGSEMGILPCESKMGTKIMSLNLLLENETDPVVWRGPIIAGTVSQFWTDVCWGEVDYMFVDMPPGTGDVALTVFQQLPIDGIVIVSSPQELVSMIVEKAVNMANKMELPIFGLVENYSYINCPDCGKEIKLFGESKIDEVAKKHGIEVIGRLPLDPQLAKNSDNGTIELFEGEWLEKAADIVE